ncbi:MAG TPA: molybdopterin molybdotransferase MoeA [Candidatus Brocadiia bacterium]|nr:molybdopterin molybdotransferase MoeA [Candidatus Brocadiales bacterium]
MITVEEAANIVLENVRTLPTKEMDIGDALGFCLAQDVRSDLDMPPFDKSAMDGYAVIAEDTAGAPVKLEVVENIAAGYMPTKRLKKGQASKIMTGAALPEGADAVVKVEETHTSEDGKRVLVHKRIEKGKNVSRRGEDIKAGQVALAKGTELRPQEIGILAAIGQRVVLVFSAPRIGIISTGSELVKVTSKPMAGQIRDSNSYSIVAQAKQLHTEVEFLGMVPDDKMDITNIIKRGLNKDVLILSGGVSMGEYDLVGDALIELGVEIYFKKVALRPGKPTVFGKKGNTIIFALPGNPVATLVTFILFVGPAIRKMMGFANPINRPIKATIETELIKKKKRREYLPAQLRQNVGNWLVSPVEWHGSGDLFSTTKANCLLIVPETVDRFDAGQLVDVLLFNSLGIGHGCKG